MIIVKKIKKILTSEILLYLIFGVLTTLLSNLIYNLCFNKWLDVAVSNTIATIISVTFAYITNKIWVFNTHTSKFQDFIKEILSFYAGRAFVFVVETSALKILVDILNYDSLITKAVTSVFVIILNYVISKKAVFKNKQ